MATKIQMPKLSDTMDEGKILKWLKKEGDEVEQGEVIAEVESDKADMELEAYDTGVLLKILVPEGKSASVGELIAVIGEKDEDISKELEVEKKKPEEKKKDEDKEPKGKEKKVERGEKKKPEETETAIEEMKEKEEIEEKEEASVQKVRDDGSIKASPLARRMADEHDVDLRELRGSGPEGRIVKRDIEEYLKEGVKKPPARRELVAERVELTGMRKAIARRMSESKSTVPHFYLTAEINMERMIEMRERINSMQKDIGVSFTDITVKIVAQNLLNHPKVNSYWAEDHIQRRGEVHVGVAVALDDGLITPVVRSCDQKGILEISRELKDYVERARSRKLKPEEFEGGSITISNLGMYDIDEFSAIINPPESAILAVGSILEKPIVKNGQISIGKTMKVTMSCDHRVVDGAVGAEFLRDFKNMMEEPILMLL